MTVYGLKIARTWDPNKPRDMIAAPERTLGGNVTVRTGVELRDGGWTKTGHVVLLADEARALAFALLVAAAS